MTRLISEYSSISTSIRSTILKMIYDAKASHIGSALSIVDILTVIYNSNIFDFNLRNEKDNSKFILSKGHACTALYATLYHSGFLTENEILSYGSDGSPLMHHISHHANGVEFSTGSLGHGLPFATGKAKAKKISKNKGNVLCLLGDGEMAEGSNWEALLFASHHNLNNLILIIDNNNLQSLDTVEKTLDIYSIKEKLKAFGCNVVEIDGHDFIRLENSFSDLIKHNKGPSAIIARTIKGKGVSFMENSVAWHYKNPNEEEYKSAMKELSNEK